MPADTKQVAILVRPEAALHVVSSKWRRRHGCKWRLFVLWPFAHWNWRYPFVLVSSLKTYRLNNSGRAYYSGIHIQGYYKRNRQFKHFIKPKLFKISTLTMHGFVEKLCKFVTSTYRCSMCAPLVTRHISTRQSNFCQIRVNISSSTPAVAVVIRCFRSSKVTGMGGTKTLSLTYPHKKVTGC
jgi:hypothetical protein